MLSIVTTAVLSLMVISVPQVDTQDNGYRLPTFQEFLILAPKTVRPDMVYEVHVTLNRKFYSNMLVTAVLSNNGAEYASGKIPFDEIGTKVIQMKVPLTVRPGTHKLIVEGLVQNPATRAAVSSNISNVFSHESYLPIFHNESYVFFSPKYISIFVVTDRPAYVVPSTVLFRIVAVTPDLLPAPGSMTVYVRDSNKNYVRRWIQRQLNFGMYEGGFDIEYPVNVGQWQIVVDAFGFKYEHQFEVRFWWQRSFEMNITVPVFMYDSEWGIMGLLYGEHVSGEPGYGIGNITVKVMNQDGTFMDGEISKDLGYMYSTKSFAFSLDEIREKWGDPAGKDLYFLGTLYDYYFMESLTGTGVTHVYKDGIQLKVLGRKIRTFKPSVPFSIQVAVMRSDGTKYDGFYDRQLVVTVTAEGTSTPNNIPEDKQIIPDTNILDYEIIPGENDRIIRVTIEHKQSGGAVELRCYRYYSQRNRYLALTSSTDDPRLLFKKMLQRCSRSKYKIIIE